MQIGAFYGVFSDSRIKVANNNLLKLQIPVSSQTTTKSIYQASKANSKAEKKDYIILRGQCLLNCLKKNNHFLVNAI